MRAVIQHLIPTTSLHEESVNADSDGEFGKAVVRVILTSHCSQKRRDAIKLSLAQMCYCGLTYNFVDKGEEEAATTVELPERICSTNPIVEVIGMIQSRLRENRCAYRRGYVYKLPKEAR